VEMGLWPPTCSVTEMMNSLNWTCIENIKLIENCSDIARIFSGGAWIAQNR